jgi:FKBP-type peptidyl-prolyl cis-trans isomerase (trigger factor)
LSKKTFVPAFTPRSLKYTVEKKSSHVWNLLIHIPVTLATHIKDHITALYRQYTVMPGMSCSTLPITYTQHYFAHEIEQDTQKFLYDHFIEDSIHFFLQENNITIVNWPRLQAIEGDATTGYTFTIGLSRAPHVSLTDWHAHTFIAPKRKNYTDLDIQVESFIATLQPTKAESQPIVEAGDWVNFSAQLRSPHIQAPLHSISNYWLRISIPTLATPALHQFLGCSKNNTFSIPATALSANSNLQTQSDYSFDITIKHVVKTHKLSITQVQSSLETATHTELHNKLIEIFSFRSDVSLRKAIIEELFYSLFNAFRFEIPPHAITRRKELFLDIMHKNPENSVYTKQKHFSTHVTLLAEARLKEEALIDAIAQYENIHATPEDISHYLCLASHDRLKEFLYFTPLTEETLTTDRPCNEHILTQVVRREKTLNAIIQRLAV